MKNRDLADQIVDAANQILLEDTSDETVSPLSHAQINMLNDISYFRSKKRTSILAFSRNELLKLFELEAKLVRMNNETAVVRPLKGVLITTISNIYSKSLTFHNLTHRIRIILHFCLACCVDSLLVGCGR